MTKIKIHNPIFGVPITFLGQYNPDEWVIIGNADSNIIPSYYEGMSKEFVDLYYDQGNTGSVKIGNRLIHYIDNCGKAVVAYKRILIRRK